jgi:hypothetical protein
MDEKLQPIPFVTVSLRGLDMSTQTDTKGNYEFTLAESRYEVVYTLFGYLQGTATIIVQGADVAQNIILQKNKNTLEGIKVVTTKKDKSEEYVKKCIQAKDDLQKEAYAYSVDMYIKGNHTYEIVYPSEKPKNDSIAKMDTIKAQKDLLARNSIFEAVIKLDKQFPNKIKEVRDGVKKRGSTANIFFKTETEGDFNFYNNLLQIPGLSEMSFLSPISYSGLIAYKYKLVNSFYKDSVKYYRIKVTPRKSGNALIEGEITIQDSTWALVNCIATFPKHLVAEYKKFTAEINFEQVKPGTYLPSKKIFTYLMEDGSKGSTVATYSDYNLQPNFPAKYFNDELSSTTKQAYERDSTYWQANRTTPLTNDEIQLIHYKDSLIQLFTSKKYLDSLDKKENKFKWQDPLFGYSNSNRYNERYYNINGLLSMFNPFFIGGMRVGQGFIYSKKFKNKTRFNGFAFGNYGLTNKDVLGTINLNYTYNPFSQGRVGVNFGSNFDFIFSGDAVINLLNRSNVYKKNNFSVYHSVELRNGLYLYNELEFARRSSLKDYKLVSRYLDTTLFNGRNNTPIDFPTYDALYNVITLSYTPHQLYIREPYEKVVLGSKWPTFYVKWRKGVPKILNSVINYDYLEAGLNKKMNAGTLGIGFLSAYYGNFLSKKRLEVVDYKWVRRGDPWVFFNPEFNFQALDSTFSMFKGFIEGHYYHQFNGAFINKIPYAKYLNIVESAGGSVLYSKERNLFYGEVYAGLEKQIKLWSEKFRIGGYFVSSYANQFSNPVQWKIGIRHYNEYTNKWE